MCHMTPLRHFIILALIVTTLCFLTFVTVLFFSEHQDTSVQDQPSPNDVRNLGFKLQSSQSSEDVNGEEYYDIVGEPSEDDDYPEFSDNEVFADGDFDYGNSSKVPVNVGTADKRKVSSPVIRNSQQIFRIKMVEAFKKTYHKADVSKPKLRNVSMVNFEGIPIVEDGVYWSKDLAEIAPKGVNGSVVRYIMHKLRNLKISSVKQPSWNQCGRPKNLFLKFEDGSKACARYRAPHQYLVQGEVLSFYLSRLLSITNVPVVTLVSSDVKADRWSNPKVQNAIRKSGWMPNVTVALIQWIDQLERDKMPSILVSALMNHSTIHGHTDALYDLSSEQLIELLQWSDLILFDYLTGNYDRVASMQDAADKEKKPSILKDTIHNLVKSRKTKSLWMIDNESGLLDSYSLLYGKPGLDERFLNFHKNMLNTTCLFRRTTVAHLERLREAGNPGEILLDYVRGNERLFPDIPDHFKMSSRLLERINEVHDHIERCKSSI